MKKKILLIDDDVAFATSLGNILESKNYEVVVAADGEEAVKIADVQKPDLVILDIFLPLKGGITVFQEIKQGNPKVPIVVITGKAQLSPDMFHLKEAYDFFRKPIDPALLINTIENALAKGDPAQENKEQKDIF